MAWWGLGKDRARTSAGAGSLAPPGGSGRRGGAHSGRPGWNTHRRVWRVGGHGACRGSATRGPQTGSPPPFSPPASRQGIPGAAAAPPPPRRPFPPSARPSLPAGSAPGLWPWCHVTGAGPVFGAWPQGRTGHPQLGLEKYRDSSRPGARWGPGRIGER